MALLEHFGYVEMMALRSQMRSLFDIDRPQTFEGAAQRVARLFRDELLDENGDPACALVRVYKTHPFQQLDLDLQDFARSIEPEADSIPELRCLTLVATTGQEPGWNSRLASKGHRAIPLSSVEAVERAPMVARLIQQLGIPIADVVRPERGLLLDTDQTAQGVFFVPQAAGSPYIVAQDEFVVPYGITSVIGFGGLIASGDLVAAILFSKVPVNDAVATQFKVIGLNFKLAMLSFAFKPLFEDARAF
ncbi:MAG: hypothetical protein ABI718_08425 [Acidobacteriota bacterium]